VQVAVAVEHDLVDLSLEADLRDQRADLLGSLGLVTLAKGALQIGRQRGSSRQRASVHVVHDLCVDVARTAEHGQARTTLHAGDLVANAKLTALTPSELSCHGLASVRAYLRPLPALPALRRICSPR